MERSILVIVSLVAVVGVLIVFFQPEIIVEEIPPQKLILQPVPQGSVSLDKELLKEISRNPFTKSHLQRFRGKFWIKKTYTQIEVNDKTYYREFDNLEAQVLARLYSKATKDEIDFSSIPYGFEYFKTTVPKELPENIREKALKVLKEAGLNRRELIRGTLALQTDEERLAAWYLLANLESSVFQLSSGFSLPDAELMDAQTLYENIKYAVKAKNMFQKLNWTTFVKHILPHRVSKEPLQRWRKHVFEAFAPVVQQFKNEYDAAKFVHEVFRKIVVYSGDTDWEDQGILTMLQTHQGRSGEMANFQAALMRAVGLRAGDMIMYWWPKSTGNHGYNYVVVTENGVDRIIFFDDGSWDIPFVQDSAKGFKSVTFDTYEDVTDKLAPATSVSLQVDKPFVEVYWNVFNSGGWATVAAAESNKEGKVKFDKIGNRQDYLFSVSYDPYYERSDVGTTLALSPFILHANSSTVTFLLLEEKESDESKERFVLDKLTPYLNYTLWRYSRDGFVKVREFVANGVGKAILNDGKEGHLFFVTPKQGVVKMPYERPFVYQKGKILFY